MEKTKLHELLLENKKRFFSKIDRGEYIPREIQYTVAPLLNTKEIFFITGIRRTGTSTLLLLLSKDLIKQYNVPIHNLFYFNFEDERCVDFTNTFI
jgi:predicted AAA+ superfamily ATPase